MSSACCNAIGSVVPIWAGGGGGGGGAVNSVFGRVGNVVAAAGDYDSDLITNVSGVTGATVSLALDQLNADKADKTITLTAGAGLTGGGDLSANRTFDVVANADGSIAVNADDIQVGVLATDAQHGVRGGGTQHAVAVASGAAGFLSGADKAKLDGITPGAAVTSVFGRTGAVVAVAGDYTSSQITNSSGVTGATVTAALNTLDAGKLSLTGGQLTGHVGQTPTAFAHSATLSIDVSTNNTFQQNNALTSAFTLTLTNGVDGDQGQIVFQQDGTGGRKITAITVAGRTVTMQEGITTINTPAFLVPNARGVFTYQYYTVNGSACVIVGMTGDQTLSVA